MSLRSDPLDRLSIPDGTVVEEHDLVTDGDVVVGGQTTIEFGVRGQNVIAGERVRFGGDIEADGDCRLDMWCDVSGNVLVGEDAYLGERAHVGGQLMVSGDLDIGDDVDIEEGFEANGWIVIRNPVPTVVFLFIYLAQLLRIGEEEAAEDVWNELTTTEERDPLLVPRSAHISDDAWRVSTPATIGAECRLHGNLRAAELDIGHDTELFGSLRARSDIAVASGTVVHGDVTTRGGTVRVADGVQIRGDVSCERLELDDDAEIDGSIRARDEVRVVQDENGNADAMTAASDEPTTASDEPTTDDAEPEPAIVPVNGGRADAESAIVRVEPAITAIEREGDGANGVTEVPDDGEGTANGRSDRSDGSDDPADSEDVTIPDAEEVAAEGQNDDPDQGGLAGAIAEAERR